MGNSLGPQGKRPELYGIGGWLAFLCVSLLLLTPISALRELAGMVTASDMAASDKAFAAGFIAAATGFAVFAGLGLVQMWRRALLIAKAYFFFNLALGLLMCLGALLGEGTPADTVLAVYVVLQSAAWLAYLYLSRRMRNTYGQARAEDVSETFR